MEYLRINKNNDFGFVDDGLHEILDSDIELSHEEYLLFFKKQSEGKMFRMRENPTGGSLFNYVEEYQFEEVKKEKTLSEMMNDLQKQKATLETLEALIKEKLKE